MAGVAVKPGERAPGDGFLVLWLGGPGRWEPAVQAKLGEAGVRVEDSGLDVLVERASQRAPDLIVLTGAAAGAPKSVISRLDGAHPARSVPLVAITNAESARPKARARYGLVAQLDRDAGEDELAKQLLALLRGLSRRPAKWRLKAGRADIPTIAQRFGRNTRSGLLTAKGAGGMAFDRSVGVAPAPEVLVSSIPTAGVEYLTFYERAPGQIRILDEPPHEDETAPPLEGARVLVIDADLERAQAMAVRLEGAGAQARAVGLDKGAIIGARSLDPTLVIVGAPSLAREACEPLWVEPRLACAALLVLSDRAFGSSPALFLSTAAELCSLENGIRRRLESGVAIAERLASLGTARWLKVLGRCKHDVTFRVFAASGRGRVDIKGGRVRGAAFRPADTRMAMVEGRAAVDLLLALPFGRVLAGPSEQLQKLEGVRASRKMSLIGQVGRTTPRPKSPPPEARGRGLVAAEVLAPMRVPTPIEGLSRPPSPKKKDPTTRPPPPQPGSEAKLPNFQDDDFEAPTRNYNASAMANLEAELRTAAKVSEPPPPGSVSPRRASSSSVPPRRASSSSVPPRRASSSSVPPRKRTPVPARRTPVSVKRTPLPPKPAESKNSPIRRRSASSPPSVSPLPEPILSARPISTPPVAESPEPKSKGASWWFAAGIALALGVGGYAAWQLSTGTSTGADPDPSPVDTTPDEPAVDEPAVDEPAVDEPAVDEPAVDEPAVDEPAVDEPAVHAAPDIEPASEQVEPDEPMVEPGAIQLPETDASVERLIEQTIDASRARDYPQSEIYARQALARSPHHAVAAYRLGVALYRQQRHEEALTWAQRSTQWDPTEPRPFSIQGDIYMRTGHFNSAARAYQSAVDLEANYGPALRGLERLRARGVVE